MSGDDFTALTPEKQPWESSGNLERRALSRLEGDLHSNLPRRCSALRSGSLQTMKLAPLPKSAAQTSLELAPKSRTLKPPIMKLIEVSSVRRLPAEQPALHLRQVMKTKLKAYDLLQKVRREARWCIT
jgi:hypothetical protein